MAIRGFEDPNFPVIIKVDAPGLPTTEITLDGTLAESTTYGLLAQVGGIRYGVPWHRVIYIKQQAVAPPAQPPTPPVVAPTSPPASTGGDSPPPRPLR